MGAATDVKNGVSNNDGAALRSGGFESAAIGSGSASKVVYERSPGHWSGKDQVVPTLGVPVATTSNHQIDGVTSGTAWGNGVLGDPAAGKTMTLECGSCHDPHGNGNYRILKPLPNDAGTQVSHEILAAVVDNPTTTTVDETKAAVMSNASGISIPDQVTKEYTTTNYWLTGAPTSPPTINGAVVASPDGFIANVSDWCSTCHNRYLAKSGSWGQDSGDPTYTYRHTSNRIDKVGTRNCITCHVAHGSNAAMSGTSATFTAPDGTTPVKTSRLLRVDNRGTCVMCHNV